MLNLAIVFLVLLLLPFFLGYLQARAKKVVGLEATFIYYRYFMLFNVVLAGIFVAIRMFIDGQHAAALTGWPYSPLYHLYGIAVLSMALPALLVFIPRGGKIYAPALTWIVFVVLSTIAYIVELSYQEFLNSQTVYLHIAYNILVAGTLTYFVNKLMCPKSEQKQIDDNAKSATEST